VAKTPAPLANVVASKLVNRVKAVFKSGAAPESQSGTLSTEESIRLRAYLRWDAAGRPGGDGVRFWLEAEKELSQSK